MAEVKMFDETKDGSMGIFRCDVRTIRPDRQKDNYKSAEDSLLSDNDNLEGFNNEALKRVEEHLDMDRKKLVSKMREDDSFAKLLSLSVSVRASRQGLTDEKYIIGGVANYLTSHGVELRNLGSNDLVPLDDGEVMSRKEAKSAGYKKENMLKSFDFEGNIKEGRKFTKILGSAKVCVADGGHQDNVREEMNRLIKWANEHGKEDTLYVVLVDTSGNDLFEELAGVQREENVWVEDHKSFQSQERIREMTS